MRNEYKEVQGASKKMIHSDFSLKSVPGVRFYFNRGVLETEFCARIMSTLIVPIKYLKCLKNAEKGAILRTEALQHIECSAETAHYTVPDWQCLYQPD